MQRKTTSMNMRFDPELKEIAARMASRDGRTVSGLIEHLVRREAERQGFIFQQLHPADPSTPECTG